MRSLHLKTSLTLPLFAAYCPPLRLLPSFDNDFRSNIPKLELKDTHHSH